jgi:hypothetical protein
LVSAYAKGPLVIGDRGAFRIDSQYKVIIPAQEAQIHWTSRHHLGQWRQYL